MADTLLIPAYPQVLAPGLLIRFGGAPHVVTFVEPTAHSAKGFNANAVNVDPADPELGTEIGPLYHHLTRLDLREPAVRDAVARAIWRTLRPNEPEPLTAPVFASHADGAFFTLEHQRFVAHSAADYEHEVPALGNVALANPDRDLLALAAIAAHVLGGSNG